MNYYAPGYEQPNEKASEAIKMLARLEGLFVDPVYTGKALAGLIDHIRTGKVEPGSNVVFWHTGGATARDVKALIELVQKRVFETSGYCLQPEVRIW